ncbi:MAG TPA: hypothetical protein VLG45_00195, partial [Thermodesulfobacteriota bacterium]|nr:hypothetical protein [Thermodesulfobacteriota bacterium]
PIESIIKRLENLSGSIKTGGEPRARLDEPRGEYQKTETAAEDTPVSTPTARGVETHVNRPKPEPGDLGSVIKFIKSRNAIMGTRLEQAKNISVAGDSFRVTFGNPLHTSHFRKSETQVELRDYLKECYSRDLVIEIAEDTQAEAGEAGSGKNDRSENKKKIQNDPALKDAIEIFGGRVVSVKPKQKE